MPRYNDAGRPTTGYCTTWFDGTRTIRYNVPDGNLNVELSDGTHLYGPAPISLVYAGVGHWAAQQGGPGVPNGVLFDGVFIPDAALGGYCDPIGPDGSLIVKRHYQSYGPWGFCGGADFGVLNPTGPSDDSHTVTNYGNGRASWIAGAWIFHTNFGSPYDGIACYNYRLKGAHFLFQSALTGELILDGHVIGPSGNYYRPDIFVTPTGFRVAYSQQEGEPTVTELVMSTAELATKPQFVARVVLPVSRTPPPPTAVSTPAPTPENAPVSVPDRSAELASIVATLTFNMQDNSMANCAAILHAAIEKFHADDPRWGYISKVAGEMQYEGRSQDSAAFKDGGNVVSVKMISGAGDPHPVKLVWVVGGALRSTDSWLYPDSASFGQAPPQGVPPVSTPQPAPAAFDPAPLLVAIAQTQSQVQQMQAQIDALKASIPDTSQFLRKGAKASGSISLVEVVESKKVSWDIA